MKTTTVTADMISSELFNRFYDSTDGNDYSNLDVANTESYEFDVEVDGEDRSVAVIVYTKFININDAYHMALDGYKSAEKIYDQVTWTNQKWEVEPGFGESDLEIVVEQEAQDKLDTLHDEWEELNKEYAIAKIERFIEESEEEQE